MSREHPYGISNEQIEDMLYEIKCAWKQHRHLRLIQLITSAAHKYTEFKNDTFYLEDSELKTALRSFADE